MENSTADSGPQRAPQADALPKREDENASWGIALSGGGLRATLFELGILLYFALAGKLSSVSGFVSVSGGTILAAHLALNWQRASRSSKGFSEVASELIEFTQRDVRNRAFVRWMWCHVPLVTFLCPSFRNIHFLRKQYDRLYGTKTLQDLSRSDDFPTFAFVTTDTVQRHRVAFTRNRVWRIKFDGTVYGDKVLATGTPVSLAVAASSCFPPVFSRLKVTNEELRITWDEFGDKLTLSDGGVSGNLGVEVLMCLVENGDIRADRLLICNAEPGVIRAPADSLLTIADAMGAALSEAGKQKFKEFAPGSKECALVARGPEEFDLRTGVVTSVAGYRTDLDRPTWDECFALIVHGAVVAQQQLEAEFNVHFTPEEIRGEVRDILKGAGCQQAVVEPMDDDLRGSDKRRYGRIIFHGVLIAILYLLTVPAISEILSRSVWSRFPRPYSYAVDRIWPEPVFERDLDCLLWSLTRATCADSKARDAGDANNIGIEIQKLKTKLEGTIAQIDITVGEGSNESRLKVVEDRQLPECKRAISCQVAFRGSFPGDLHRVNARVTVTGRVVKIEGRTATANMDVAECTAKPTATP